MAQAENQNVITGFKHAATSIGKGIFGGITGRLCWELY